MAGVVAIDLGGPAAAIEIGMQDAQSGKGHEIESTVQAEMVFRDPGHADLGQITDRGEEGHCTKRKIGIHVVIETKPQREGRIVRRIGPESEIGGKAPVRILRLRRSGGAGPQEADQGKADQKEPNPSCVRHSPTI